MILNINHHTKKKSEIKSEINKTTKQKANFTQANTQKLSVNPKHVSHMPWWVFPNWGTLEPTELGYDVQELKEFMLLLVDREPFLQEMVDAALAREVFKAVLTTSPL